MLIVVKIYENLVEMALHIYIYVLYIYIYVCIYIYVYIYVFKAGIQGKKEVTADMADIPLKNKYFPYLIKNGALH